MKVRDEVGVRHRVPQAREQIANAAGVSQAHGVANGNVLHAALAQPERAVDHMLHVHRAIEGAAEHKGDRSDHGEAAARRVDHRADHIELILRVAVEGPLEHALAGRENDADLVRAKALVGRGDGALHRARVDAGRLVASARPALDGFEQLVRVEELRDIAGVRERSRLDPLEAERREVIDKRDLLRSRDDGGLMLQPVAGEALAENDLVFHSTLAPEICTSLR